MWFFATALIFASCDGLSQRSDELRGAHVDPVWTALGVRIEGREGVFPPQLGSGSVDLATVISTVSNRENLRFLDMGCGSGFVGLVAKQSGFASVSAVDRHEPAVLATRHNATVNHLEIEVHHSDHFGSLPEALKFDVIAYNFFYYPESGPERFGPARDGGRVALEDFLLSARARLRPGGRIAISFSQFGGETHDPANLAPRLGWKVTVASERSDSRGWHRVYWVTP